MPDPRSRAGLRSELAVELIYTGDAERRAALSAEADALLDDVPDLVERHQLRALIERGAPWSWWTSARSAASLEQPDHLAALEAADPTVRNVALAQELFSALRMGDGDRVRRVLVAIEELANQTHHPQIEDFALLQRMMARLVDGDLDAAADAVQAMVESWTRHNRPSLDIYTSSATYQIARERGLLPLALAMLEQPERPEPTTGAALFALAHLEAGNVDTVLAVIDQCGRNRFEDVADDAALPVASAAWSEAAAGARHHGACMIWYERLVDDPDLHFVTGGWYIGSSTRNLGLLAAALGRVDDARNWFERAAAAHDRMRTPPWLARGLLDWAELELDQGDPARAAELTDRAVAVIADLPLDGSRARAERLARASA